MSAPEINGVALRIDIHGWWRSGTGAGRVAQLDALCVRDPGGLPYLPGRHIRGLMRDAVRRLGEWDKAYYGADNALFGDWGFRSAPADEANRDNNPVPYRGARRGALAFSDAAMEASERALFFEDLVEADEARHAPLRNNLFAVRHSTAIRKGVAAEHTLRAEEVAVPMTLYGTVDFLGFPPAGDTDTDRWQGDWLNALEAAAPLIRAVGAKRLRGLGRASIFVGEDLQ